MSEQIKQAFYHALAARGAYANLKIGEEVTYKTTLTDTDLSQMSEEMADYFLSHFKVLDSITTGSSTGYNGLILQEKDAQGNLTNHYILANRGTEVPDLPSVLTAEAQEDLLTDLMIGLIGFGQANPQVFTMKTLIDKLPTGDVNITTAGHSLGGFLSTMAVQLFAIQQGYTYNSAGSYSVAGLTGSISNILSTALGIEILNNVLNTLGLPQLGIGGNIKNYLTAEGLSLVPSVGILVGTQIKVNTDAYVENDLSQTPYNHYIFPISDALLVIHTLGQLDNNLTIEQANKFLEAMTKTDRDDRDAAIIYIAKLFDSPELPILASNTQNNWPNDNQLEKAAFALLAKFEPDQDSDDYEAQIISLVDKSASQLTQLAQADSSDGALTRHALLNSSSFAISNPIQGAEIALNSIMTQASLQADYFKSSSNNDPALDIHDFWVQFGKYHELLLKYNVNPLTTQTLNAFTNTTFINAWDVNNIQTLSFGGLGEFLGIDKKVVFFGSTGFGEKHGGSNDDHLYGLGGTDVLKGHEGQDFIDGGQGNDTLSGDEGDDTLLGGLGTDQLDGGIGEDLLDGGDGEDTIKGGDDNDILIGGKGDDELKGDKGKDKLYGGEDNDILDGGIGHDELYGDAGNDTLIGGFGNDSLEGGADNDTYIFTAGDGDDIISDNQGNNVLKITGQSSLSAHQIAQDASVYQDQAGNRYVRLEDIGLQITLAENGGRACICLKRAANDTSYRLAV